MPFKAFYNSLQKMKDNDKQCPHILSRFEALQQVTSRIQGKDLEKMSEDLRAGLEKLNVILESTEKFINKFNETNAVVQMVKATAYKVEFEDLNKSLTDAFVTFSAALHIHQEKELEGQQGALRELLEGTAGRQQEANLQKERQAEQERRLREQEARLAEQERRLRAQQEKVAEQEELLERLEAQAVFASRAFYCTLL